MITCEHSEHMGTRFNVSGIMCVRIELAHAEVPVNIHFKFLCSVTTFISFPGTCGLNCSSAPFTPKKSHLHGMPSSLSV